MSGELNLRLLNPDLDGLSVQELESMPTDFADTVPDGLKQFELILKGESIVNVQVYTENQS